MTKFYSGDWLIICDVCSKKIKSSESKKRWDGLIVCEDDFEFRHPQDFVRAKTDKIAVPFIRKDPGRGLGLEDQADLFLCNEAQLGIADSGESDFAQADISSCEQLNAAPLNIFTQSAIAGIAVSGYSIAGTVFLGSL